MLIDRWIGVFVWIVRFTEIVQVNDANVVAKVPVDDSFR